MAMASMFWRTLGFSLAMAAITAGCARGDNAAATAPPKTAAGPTLQAFANEAQFASVLARWHEANQVRRARLAKVELPKATMANSPPAPVEAADAAAEPSALDTVSAKSGLLDRTGDDDAITSVQTAGVDEGDIVKRRGEHLVILHRGRLFTIRIGGDLLQPISSVDAYGPDIDPDDTWYDEMLASGHTVVVIGYSYARGGTEIGLFDLDDSGGLKYRATYHLRSNDYYSSRNYASRLIGDKLVFYSPMFLQAPADDFASDMPALRRWHAGATAGEFRRILPATRIYRAAGELASDDALALHTVTVCDLASIEMTCDATAVLGPPGQTFYVSEDAAFVWASGWHPEASEGDILRSDVFRIPLDGSAPSAMRAAGAPVDQMSFLQKDGYLNVLVGAESNGQWMWSSDAQPGDLALLRVPLSMFGDGSQVAQAAQYRPLRTQHRVYGVQNRYVGDWLIVGGGWSWEHGDTARYERTVHAIRYGSQTGFVDVPVDHEIERIEALGWDALVVGNDGDDLHFSSLRLDTGLQPVGRFVLAKAAQGDQRTHGFFYRPTRENEGVIGLPVVARLSETRQQASVMYLRNRDLQLGELGRLDAHARADAEDGCKASCVDWYGDARPIFIGQRVFALMGYELVEGVYAGDRIVERRRVDFSPRVAIAH